MKLKYIHTGVEKFSNPKISERGGISNENYMQHR